MSVQLGRGLNGTDVFAWALNVVSCVFIIMVNKQLTSAKGYAFTFATTLSGMHFIITGFASKLIKQYLDDRKDEQNKQTDEKTDTKEKRHLPLMDLVTFVIVANLSIASLNTSLMINNVSLYQIAKLGIPPLSAVIERVWFGNSYAGNQIGAMFVTLVGVSLVTVAEFKVAGDSIGVGVALVSVVSSALQQILCGYYQRKNKMSSNDFLNAVSLWQGVTCLFFGPFMDYAFTHEWVMRYQLTYIPGLFIVLSCLLSVVVNASHF
eukprot:gene16610-25477_t